MATTLIAEPTNGLVNLTPHTVCVRFVDKESGELRIIEFPSAGGALLIGSDPVFVEATSAGVPVRYPRKHYALLFTHNPTNDAEGIIVSALAAEALQTPDVCPRLATRSTPLNVYSPDTNPDSAILNERGEIVAVKALVKHTTLFFNNDAAK